MPEEKKKPGVFDYDINRLMKLATHQSNGNVVGFAATLLATKLQSLQEEQAKAQKEEEKQLVLIEEHKPETPASLPPGTLIVNTSRMPTVLQPWIHEIYIGVIEEASDDPVKWNKNNSEKEYCKACNVIRVRYPFGIGYDKIKHLIPITQEQANLSFREKIGEFLGKEALRNYDRCNSRSSAESEEKK